MVDIQKSNRVINKRLLFILMIAFIGIGTQLHAQNAYQTKQLGLLDDSCWSYSVLDAASRFTISIDKIKSFKFLRLYFIKGELTISNSKNAYPYDVFVYKGVNDGKKRVLKNVKFVKEIYVISEKKGKILKKKFKIFTRIKKGYHLYFYKNSYSTLELIIYDKLP